MWSSFGLINIVSSRWCQILMSHINIVSYRPGKNRYRPPLVPPPCILLCMVSFLSFSRLCDHFDCCTLTEEWLKCSCIYAIFGFSLKGYELFQPFDFRCGSDDRTESDGNQGVGIIPKMNKYRSVSAILQSTCNSQSDHSEVKNYPVMYDNSKYVVSGSLQTLYKL